MGLLTADLEVYSFLSGEWTSYDASHTGLTNRKQAPQITIDNKLYFFGGYDFENGNTNQVYTFNPDNNTVSLAGVLASRFMATAVIKFNV